MEQKEQVNEKEAKEKVYLNELFYTEELENYTDDEKEIQERKEQLKNVITNFNQNNLDYLIESILNDNKLLSLIARCIKGDNNPITFNEERLNNLISQYITINNCFKNDGFKKTMEIVDIYKETIPKDENGFYKLTDSIVDKVINDNEFYISDNMTKDFIKDEIFNTWENQEEIITQDSLNSFSEARNGLPFKHFIFCEEYIRRGKIKPTCEKLGISRNTAYLWLNNEKVQKYLNDRKKEIKQDSDTMFINLYANCFSELNDIINGDYIDTSSKIKAIDTFLRHYANINKANTSDDN